MCPLFLFYLVSRKSQRKSNLENPTSVCGMIPFVYNMGNTVDGLRTRAPVSPAAQCLRTAVAPS